MNIKTLFFITTIFTLNVTHSHALELEIGAHSIRGNRTNEDAFIIPKETYKRYSIFAVFDGNGGDGVSRFLKNNFEKFFKNNLSRKKHIANTVTVKMYYVKQ